MPVQVHAVVEGPPDAPVVLMAGSLGSTLEMWDGQAPALAEQFQVVRYDGRGHGRSPAPPGPYALDDLVDDAVALLDRLGVQRASFVGLSLGGFVGMRLAAREPERADRLVLMCTTAHFADAAPWRERAAAVRAGGTASVARTIAARWVTPDAGPALLDAAEAMVASQPAEAYATCCDLLAEADVRPDLPQIRAATLLLAGEHDPSTPPAALQEIADALPGARLVVLPDSAHLANLQQPAAVNALLLEHLPR